MKTVRERKAGMLVRGLGAALCIVAAGVPLILQAAAPGWWNNPDRPVVATGVAGNDYAPVNQGQVKNLATAAIEEFGARLPNGAGPELNRLVLKLSQTTAETNDFAPVNIGQLKNLAKPFYDRLAELISPPIPKGSNYPWLQTTGTADDYVWANIGQAKNLFAFDLSPYVIVSGTDGSPDGTGGGTTLPGDPPPDVNPATGTSSFGLPLAGGGGEPPLDSDPSWIEADTVPQDPSEVNVGQASVSVSWAMTYDMYYDNPEPWPDIPDDSSFTASIGGNTVTTSGVLGETGGYITAGHERVTYDVPWEDGALGVWYGYNNGGDPVWLGAGQKYQVSWVNPFSGVGSDGAFSIYTDNNSFVDPDYSQTDASGSTTLYVPYVLLQLHGPGTFGHPGPVTDDPIVTLYKEQLVKVDMAVWPSPMPGSINVTIGSDLRVYNVGGQPLTEAMIESQLLTQTVPFYIEAVGGGTDYAIGLEYTSPAGVTYSKHRNLDLKQRHRASPKHTISADEVSGPKYRRIALNGRPISDEKPQSREETDEENESTYVDALTLELRHSVTDVYVPIPGSELSLSVRRTLKPEIWNYRSGLRPHENPAECFGAGWAGGIAPYVEVIKRPKMRTMALVTDENGQTYKFVEYSGTTQGAPSMFVPVPTGRHDQSAALSSFDGAVFSRKYGTTISFALSGSAREIAMDRENGSDEKEVHKYYRAVHLVDRVGTTIVYSGSGLIPDTISVLGRPDLKISISHSNGRIQSVWDPNGVETTYGYTGCPVEGRNTSEQVLQSVLRGDSTVPTTYSYEIVKEGDLTPLLQGETPVPKWHCNLTGITNARGKSYGFSYEFNHLKESYRETFGNFTETGLPRMISHVSLPDGAGSAVFTATGAVKLVFDQNSQPSADGTPTRTVTDAAGGLTTYIFSGASVQSVPDPSNADADYPMGIPANTICYTLMDVDFAGVGVETFEFQLSAGMALKKHTDLCGNTTTFSYTTPVPRSSLLVEYNGLYGSYSDDPDHQSNANGKVKFFRYASQHILRGITDEDGRVTEYQVDGFGRRQREDVYGVTGQLERQTIFAYGSSVAPGVVTRQTIKKLPSDPAWARDMVTEYVLDLNGRVKKEIVAPDSLRLTTETIYDANGNKLAVIDPDTWKTSFDYDGRNRITHIHYPGYPNPETKSFEYDDAGNKTAVVDENNHRTEFIYDGLNRLTETRYIIAGGTYEHTHSTYNAVGSKTSSTDERGNATVYEYDDLQRLKHVINASGTTHYEYGINSGGNGFDTTQFKPTRITDPRGYVTERTYDKIYRLKSESVAYGSGTATRYLDYDGVGNLTSETDPLTRTTTHTYDALGRSGTTTYANNTQTVSRYTSSGLLWRVKDEAQRVSESRYDVAGRPVRVYLPKLDDGSQAVTISVYDPAGNVIEKHDPRGNVWTYRYDGRKRKIRESAPPVTGGTAVTRWAYDGVGNITSVIDPRGNTTDTEYDERNRVETVTGPLVPIVGGGTLRPVTQTTYYPGGLVWTVTDPNNNVTTNTYNAMGWLETTTNPEQETVVYNYDKVGNRKTVKDGRGYITRFEYDGLNRNTKITDPLNGVTDFEYDDVNKTARVDGNNRRTEYLYDLRHRLKQVVYPADPAQNRTYHYDLVGNLETVTTGQGGVTDVIYTYDALNRVTTETSAGRQHVYEYDLAGNRTRSTYGGTGIVVTGSYDALGRPETYIQVTGTSATTGTSVTQIGYDLAGNIVSRTLPNGQLETSEFDALNRLSMRKTQMRDGSTLIEIAQKYDKAGNVRRIEESYPGSTIPSRVVESTYDFADRLEVETATSGTNVVTRTFGYDDAGNRATLTTEKTGVSAVTTSYSYNGFNQLTGWSASDGTGATYEYDGYGNRKKRISAGKTTDYVYDFENRLIHLAESGTVSGTYDYQYDYRTRRVNRTENGQQTNVTFSGGVGVEEFQPSGATIVSYLRGPDMGGGVGGLLYSIRSGTASYSTANARGDIIAKTGSTGALTYLASYEAFGQRTAEFGSTQDRQKANTKEEDPTGLLDEGNRYRDLETGNFITADPAGFVDGPNRYTYVRQNPWTKFDPEGLAEQYISGGEFFSKQQMVERDAARELQQYRDSCRVPAYRILIVPAALVVVPLAVAAIPEEASAAAIVWATRAAVAYATNPVVKGAVTGAVVAGVTYAETEDPKAAIVNGVFAGMEGYASTPKQPARVQINAQQGAAAEKLVAGQLAEEGKTILGRRVAVNTSEGRRVLDNLVEDNGKLVNVEVKSGGATRNSAQVAKDGAMATEGGTPVGKNAPADLRGKQVKIETEVRTVKSEDLP